MEKELIKIYEDENIVVIDKPFGLVVNRSNTYKDVTLQDMLDREYFSLFKDIEDEEFVSRSGLVHRLDKDTSGVIVIAKNLEAFNFLQAEFKERNTYKEYAAVVHGRIGDEIIEINAPLKRNPKTPMKMAVVSDGKKAFTRIEKITSKQIEDRHYTLLKVLPKTGRTHQIRVHLSAIHHPIVGDTIYCSNNLLDSDLKLFKRMMLHARFLGIRNPSNKKFQRFESPLPNEFKI
ncbi:RluA family pseudouridine synthase [Patescibacteria group bacterium]|nr:RluA family pseudouridine synthase [Patescibacteria group bacterium]